VNGGGSPRTASKVRKTTGVLKVDGNQHVLKKLDSFKWSVYVKGTKKMGEKL